MREDWNQVTREHVIEAIQRYSKEQIRAPESRNTFLLYESQLYPAKHIRGMAYEIATGMSIRKDEYSGGSETAKFLRNRGFEVQHEATGNEKPIINNAKKRGAIPSSMSVISQKNALQRLLQRKLGILETEKKYAWLTTPDRNKLPAEYRGIYDALIEFCGSDSFIKSNYPLLCDFCIEDFKTLIEYDERQHFTRARKLTLERYSEIIKCGYSVEDWIRYCDKVDAKDTNPPLRDEGRALFDAVRDIQAWKNGYLLIRIRHGEFDWESPNAEKYLKIVLDRAKQFAAIKNCHEAKDLPVASKIDQSFQEYDFRTLEIEAQRIRLNFMKWIFYFTPPEHEVYKGSGKLNSFKLFQSPSGRSFSLFPCGSGSVYAGGGSGSVNLDPRCFKGPLELTAETEEIKKSISIRVSDLRSLLNKIIYNNKRELFWDSLQNYYWIKLGLHEYVFDAHFYADREYDRLFEKSVRDYVVIAMRMALDLKKEMPIDYGNEELEKALSYNLTWNKYAMCSFDCGPIAWGRRGYIPFSEIAQQRLAWDAQHNEELRAIFKIDNKNRKRLYAQSSLLANHHFEVKYDKYPLSDALNYDGFMRSRDSIRRVIESAQEKINDVITTESLTIKPLLFMP